jgi:hypothetical protein
MENYQTTIIAIQIKRKGRRIGHTLRKPTGCIEESALDLEDDGRGSCGCGEDRAELKDLLLTRSGGSVSQMPCAPEGETGINSYDSVVISFETMKPLKLKQRL